MVKILGIKKFPRNFIWSSKEFKRIEYWKAENLKNQFSKSVIFEKKNFPTTSILTIYVVAVVVGGIFRIETSICLKFYDLNRIIIGGGMRTL